MALWLTVVLTCATFAIPRNRYWGETCSQYVAHVLKIEPETAAEFYAGKNLVRVRECDTLVACEIAGLQDGDVLAFHGVHVAVYTEGALHDSTPDHDGPGLLRYSADSWYSGPIRVLRRRP